MKKFQVREISHKGERFWLVMAPYDGATGEHPKKIHKTFKIKSERWEEEPASGDTEFTGTAALFKNRGDAVEAVSFSLYKYELERREIRKKEIRRKISELEREIRKIDNNESPDDEGEQYTFIIV